MKKILPFLILILPALESKAQTGTEEATIKKTFIRFLQFYQKNQKQFNTFQLYTGKGKDNTPPYKIQWKEAGKYFTWLRTNVPYVGEAYIKAERTHFKYSDSCFKAAPTD